MNHEEAKEIAMDVINGQTGSYVRSAQLLAKYVLELHKDSKTTLPAPPSSQPK